MKTPLLRGKVVSGKLAFFEKRNVSRSKQNLNIKVGNTTKDDTKHEAAILCLEFMNKLTLEG